MRGSVRGMPGDRHSYRDCALMYREGEIVMSTAKTEVQSLLEKLPDDCTLEDIQYHLYVVEKVHRGIDRAAKEGEVSQQDVEKRLGKWNTE